MKNYDYWKKSQITDISNCSYWLYQKGVGIYEVGKDQAKGFFVLKNIVLFAKAFILLESVIFFVRCKCMAMIFFF
jgi:hypothetical protein